MSSYQLRNTSRATQSNSAYDDDHIYMNIDIDSSTSSGSTENCTLATANFSKSIPIVMQAEHYHLIVDRFEINGRMLPIFIFNPNKTYTVRIRAGGNNFDTNLIHVNNQGLTSNDIGYYYYYTFQSVLDIINTALATSATAAGVDTPFMTWDTDSQRFTIYATMADYGPLGALISFNIPIYRLFPAYDYITTVGSNFYQLNIKDNFNNTFASSGTVPPYGFPPLPANVSYYFLRDQFSVVDKWNPIDSIIFVSNKISLKETFASISTVNQSNTNAGTLAILTDFKLDATNSGDQRKTLIYNPSIYRLLDLYSSSPLSTIDISVYFTDKDSNQLNPIRVFEDDKISIKLLFQKKNSI
jgi:hypothetical protein